MQNEKNNHVDNRLTTKGGFVICASCIAGAINKNFLQRQGKSGPLSQPVLKNNFKTRMRESVCWIIRGDWHIALTLTFKHHYSNPATLCSFYTGDNKRLLKHWKVNTTVPALQNHIYFNSPHQIIQHTVIGEHTYRLIVICMNTAFLFKCCLDKCYLNKIKIRKWYWIYNTNTNIKCINIHAFM